nr:MAG TPA: hypothetical protein [Caudoviricetes sp.]
MPFMAYYGVYIYIFNYIFLFFIKSLLTLLTYIYKQRNFAIFYVNKCVTLVSTRKQALIFTFFLLC